MAAHCSQIKPQFVLFLWLRWLTECILGKVLHYHQCQLALKGVTKLRLLALVVNATSWNPYYAWEQIQNPWIFSQIRNFQVKCADLRECTKNSALVADPGYWLQKQEARQHKCGCLGIRTFCTLLTRLDCWKCLVTCLVDQLIFYELKHIRRDLFYLLN